jgi:hypothetical protein
MIAFAFSFLFPFLLVILVLQGLAKVFKIHLRGWLGTLVLAIGSGLMVVMPIGGLPIARWLMSVNANVSVPLMAIMFSKAWQNASGIRLLDRRGLTASWIFALIAGIMLYPMALGSGGFDPYELGWGFSWLFPLLMAFTILLLLRKNRFGIVMAACIFAYDFQLLESPNLWDYLIDPVYVLVSCAALTSWLIRGLQHRRNSRHVIG